MKKPFLVNAKIQIEPSVELATRILSEILLERYELPLHDIDLEVWKGKRVSHVVEASSGQVVNSNHRCAAILQALKLLQDEEITYPKRVIEVSVDDGFFVISVDGRVLRNVLFKGLDTEEVLKQREFAIDVAYITQSGYDHIGVPCTVVVKDEVYKVEIGQPQEHVAALEEVVTKTEKDAIEVTAKGVLTGGTYRVAFELDGNNTPVTLSSTGTGLSNIAVKDNTFRFYGEHELREFSELWSVVGKQITKKPS